MTRVPSAGGLGQKWASRAAIAGLSAALLSGAAVAQTVKSCPGLPGKYMVLERQNYALCAGAKSVNFDGITYATCAKLSGNSISEQHNYPFPSVNPQGNINTLNEGAPQAGGYVVSTYSPPAQATFAGGSLAVYTCDGGSYAQCDGGLCFSSTTGKSSPLWGAVANNEIVCSCPVSTSTVPFEVMGPAPCPRTAAAYDAVCGANVSAVNAGATIYIGAPPSYFENLAACIGQPVKLNRCARPPV